MNAENYQIWKFPVPVKDHLEIAIPKAARILCVQVQNGTPCIWAWVDAKAPKETRKFRWFGTGHPGVQGKYIGTVQLYGGDLVFHLFEGNR